MDEHLKRVVAHHDWWAETYDSDYFERFDMYHKVTMDNIKRFLPEDKQGYILDAGGGTGIFSLELAKMGYQVVLADSSKGMLEQARKKIDERGLIRRIEIVESNVCGMPEFPDNHFDMVLSEGDPLSYCGDYKSATAEFARVAKQGACVIASVDSRTSALRWLRDTDDLEAIEKLVKTGDVMMRQDQEDFSYVIHAFTSEELRELFESNGLSVERIIGKPVIAHRLKISRSEKPEVQEWLLRRELEHCDDPDWLPWGGHLEIVGRKK